MARTQVKKTKKNRDKVDWGKSWDDRKGEPTRKLDALEFLDVFWWTFHKSQVNGWTEWNGRRLTKYHKFIEDPNGRLRPTRVYDPTELKQLKSALVKYEKQQAPPVYESPDDSYSETVQKKAANENLHTLTYLCKKYRFPPKKFIYNQTEQRRNNASPTGHGWRGLGGGLLLEYKRKVSINYVRKGKTVNRTCLRPVYDEGGFLTAAQLDENGNPLPVSCEESPRNGSEVTFNIQEASRLEGAHVVRELRKSDELKFEKQRSQTTGCWEKQCTETNLAAAVAKRKTQKKPEVKPLKNKDGILTPHILIDAAIKRDETALRKLAPLKNKSVKEIAAQARHDKDRLKNWVYRGCPFRPGGAKIDYVIHQGRVWLDLEQWNEVIQTINNPPADDILVADTQLVSCYQAGKLFRRMGNGFEIVTAGVLRCAAARGDLENTTKIRGSQVVLVIRWDDAKRFAKQYVQSRKAKNDRQPQTILTFVSKLGRDDINYSQMKRATVRTHLLPEGRLPCDRNGKDRLNRNATTILPSDGDRYVRAFDEYAQSHTVPFGRIPTDELCRRAEGILPPTAIAVFHSLMQALREADILKEGRDWCRPEHPVRYENSRYPGRIFYDPDAAFASFKKVSHHFRQNEKAAGTKFHRGNAANLRRLVMEIVAKNAKEDASGDAAATAPAQTSPAAPKTAGNQPAPSKPKLGRRDRYEEVFEERAKFFKEMGLEVGLELLPVEKEELFQNDWNKKRGGKHGRPKLSRKNLSNAIKRRKEVRS